MCVKYSGFIVCRFHESENIAIHFPNHYKTHSNNNYRIPFEFDLVTVILRIFLVIQVETRLNWLELNWIEELRINLNVKLLLTRFFFSQVFTVEFWNRNRIRFDAGYVFAISKKHTEFEISCIESVFLRNLLSAIVNANNHKIRSPRIHDYALQRWWCIAL